MDEGETPYWMAVGEGFDVFRDRDGGLYIINGKLVSERSRMSECDLGKWDNEYLRHKSAGPKAAPEPEDEIICAAGVRDEVIARQHAESRSAKPKLQANSLLPSLPPWNDHYDDAPTLYWDSFSPRMRQIHLFFSKKLRPFVARLTPHANWRDYSRYRSQWRKACRQDRPEMFHWEFYRIKSGIVFRLFNDETDLRELHQSRIRETDHASHRTSAAPSVLRREYHKKFYGTPRNTRVSHMHGNDEFIANSMLAPTDTGESQRASDFNRSLTSQTESRGADKKNTFIWNSHRGGGGSSWRPPSKRHPTGSMWLNTIGNLYPEKVDAIIGALTENQRKVFNLRFYGTDGQPLTARLVAMVLNVNESAVSKTLDRINKDFRAAGLPDPMPAMDRHVIDSSVRLPPSKNPADAAEDRETKQMEKIARAFGVFDEERKRQAEKRLRAQKRSAEKIRKIILKPSYLQHQQRPNRYAIQNRHRTNSFRK